MRLENLLKMNITSTESSASSAGYKYQDIVAFEKIVELLENEDIKQVILDKKNVPHIEDVVVESPRELFPRRLNFVE